jgi:hypothetical protein
MATSERMTAKMIGEIFAFAIASYYVYVYLGPATSLFFGVSAMVVAACPEAVIATQVKRQLKEGMLSVSTLFILVYALVCGYALIIAVYTVVAALNAEFGI